MNVSAISSFTLGNNNTCPKENKPTNIYYLTNKNNTDTISFHARTIKPKTVKNIAETFTETVGKIKDNKLGLNKTDRKAIEKELAETQKLMAELEEKRLQYGRLLDYDNMRKEGTTAERITKYVTEDNQTLENAKTYTEQTAELREHMFGYPANMYEDSAVTKHLRTLEAEHPLLNGCGDAYDFGYYAMDAKKQYEQPLLDKIYDHLGLERGRKVIKHVHDEAGMLKPVEVHEGAWGYITSGGSESNKWGIMNGVKKLTDKSKNQEPIVYYSDVAHYSVAKSLGINDPGFNSVVIDHTKPRNPAKTGEDLATFIESRVIPTEKDSHRIDSDMLLDEIKKNYKDGDKTHPPVILLTWGTTQRGVIDDVAKISEELKKEDIPHYIHLDAAMYGGIAKNQKNAPTLPNIKDIDVDSVSISMHKYFGHSNVNSIVVAKEAPKYHTVDYIGMEDSTTSGSRSFAPFSSYQRVTETLERRNPEEYDRSIKQFENILNKHDVPFERDGKGNTFVIDRPSEETCKKYQLATFKDEQGKDKAHVIIFPYHKAEVEEEFAKALAKDLAS